LITTRIETAKGNFIIRDAKPADLPALVDIHVTSWNATYPDHQPKPTHQLREYQWKTAFGKKEDNWFCFVVENEHAEIAGFATGNDFTDKELPYKGQLNKIHFLKPYQRLGLGRALVGQVVNHFLKHGIHSMILFADPGNPAIKFYEGLEGERLQDKEGVFQGAYGWKELRKLSVLCKVTF
jgi:ribosomal protein S18 acetylase RimI-like enzyme